MSKILKYLKLTVVNFCGYYIFFLIKNIGSKLHKLVPFLFSNWFNYPLFENKKGTNLCNFDFKMFMKNNIYHLSKIPKFLKMTVVKVCGYCMFFLIKNIGSKLHKLVPFLFSNWFNYPLFENKKGTNLCNFDFKMFMKNNIYHLSKIPKFLKMTVVNFWGERTNIWKIKIVTYNKTFMDDTNQWKSNLTCVRMNG